MLAQTEGRLDGPLSIQRTRYGDDVIVFQLAGELDLPATIDAWRMIEPALDEPTAMLVIDLTELEFIGVKGVNLLYGLAAARPDKDLIRLLPSVHECVNRVLRMTGVGEAIPTVSH
jgi:anti-anti-sigma factor